MGTIFIPVYHICQLANSQAFIYRSSRPDVFCKKGVLENFAKFTRKYLRQSRYLNKVARTPLVAASVFTTLR